MSAAGKRHMAVCQVCGEAFRVYPSRLSKHCSLKCRDVAVRAKRVNESNGTARCAKCKLWKPLASFVKGSASRPHSYCKECSRAWFEKRRRRNGIKPKARSTDPQSIAKRKAYKYEINKRAFHQRRAAGAFPGKHELGKMLCEQDAKCAYCGRLLDSVYHVDHKQPVSRGGTNDKENLHMVCPQCNLRKGTMTHEEFLVSKKHRPRAPVTNTRYKRDELDLLAATLERLA